MYLKMSKNFYRTKPGYLEKITKEMNKPSLIVIAGRPQTGKTSISLEIASNALKENTYVVIFNLEMSKNWCRKRILSSDAFSDTGELEVENLYIDDTPAISVQKIREKCIFLKREKNLGLIVIDYLQLVEIDKVDYLIDEKNNEISKSLKVLAQELDVCILLISQLSKTEGLRKPTFSDLKYSKCLINDADIIIFLNQDNHNNLEILKFEKSKN